MCWDLCLLGQNRQFRCRQGQGRRQLRIPGLGLLQHWVDDRVSVVSAAVAPVSVAAVGHCERVAAVVVASVS